LVSLAVVGGLLAGAVVASMLHRPRGEERVSTDEKG